jgi:hypothetical protein
LASSYKVTSVRYCNQGIVKGEVSLYCTVDLLFDWFGLVCFANKNKNCHLPYNLFQLSQTGGQWYNDTSPFSIPCCNCSINYRCKNIYSNGGIVKMANVNKPIFETVQNFLSFEFSKILTSTFGACTIKLFYGRYLFC